MSNPYDTLFEKYIPVHIDMSLNKSKTDISNLSHFNTTYNPNTYFTNADDQELQPLNSYKIGNNYQKKIVNDFSSNYVKWVIDNSTFIHSVSAEQINGNWQYTLSMDYIRTNWKSNNQSASFKYDITDTNRQIQPIQTNTMVINPAILNRDTSYNHTVTNFNNSIGSTINNQVVRNTFMNINKPDGNLPGHRGIETRYPSGDYQRTSLNKFSLHQFSNSGEDLSANVVINTIKPIWNIQNQLLVTTQYDFSFSSNSLYNRYADNRMGADASFTYNLEDISLVPAIKAIYPNYNKDLSFIVYGKEMTHNTVQTDFSNVYTTNVKRRLSEKGMMIDFSYSNPIFDVSQSIFNKLMEKAIGKPASTFSNTSRNNFDTSLNIVIADGSFNGFIGALNTDSSGVVMNFAPKIQNIKDEPVDVLNRNSAKFKNRFAKTQPIIPIIEIEKPMPQTIYVGSKQPDTLDSSVFIALLNNQLEPTNPHIIHANYEANPSDISLTMTVSGDGISTGTILRHDPNDISNSSFTTIAVTAITPSKPLNQNENLPVKYVYQAILKNQNKIKAQDISSVTIEKVRTFGSGITISNELLPPKNRIPGYVPKLSLTNINSNYIFMKTAQFLLTAYSVAPILTTAGTIYINTSFSKRTIFQFDNSFSLILYDDQATVPKQAKLYLARDTTLHTTAGEFGTNYINENTSYQIGFQNNHHTKEFKVYLNGNLDFTISNTDTKRIIPGLTTGATINDIKHIHGVGIYDNSMNHTHKKLEHFRDLKLYYNNPTQDLPNYSSRFFTDTDFQNSSFENKSDYVAPVNGKSLPNQSKLTKTYEHPAGNLIASIKPKLSIQQTSHPGQTWDEHHASLASQTTSNAVQNAVQNLITANPTNATATMNAIGTSTPAATSSINQIGNIGNSNANNANIAISIAGASAGGAQSIGAAGNAAANVINNSSSSPSGTSNTALNTISNAVNAHPSTSGTPNTALSNAVSNAVQNHITNSNNPTSAAQNAIAAAAAAAGQQAAQAIAAAGGSQAAQDAARTHASTAVTNATSANTPAGAAAAINAVQNAVQEAISDTALNTTPVNGVPTNANIALLANAAENAGNAAISVAGNASTTATTISNSGSTTPQATASSVSTSITNSGSTQNQTTTATNAIAAAAASAGQQAAQAIAAAGGSQAAQTAASNHASQAVTDAATTADGNTPAGAAAAIAAVQSAVQNAITDTAGNNSITLAANAAQDAGIAAVNVAAQAASNAVAQTTPAINAINAAAAAAGQQAAQAIGAANGSQAAQDAARTHASTAVTNAATTAGGNTPAGAAAAIAAVQSAVQNAITTTVADTTVNAGMNTISVNVPVDAGNAAVNVATQAANTAITISNAGSNTPQGNASTVSTSIANSGSTQNQTTSATNAINATAAAAGQQAAQAIAAAGGSSTAQQQASDAASQDVTNAATAAGGNTSAGAAAAINAVQNVVQQAITNTAGNNSITLPANTAENAGTAAVNVATQAASTAIAQTTPATNAINSAAQTAGQQAAQAIAAAGGSQAAQTAASNAASTAVHAAAGSAGGSTPAGAAAAIAAVQSAVQNAITNTAANTTPVNGVPTNANIALPANAAQNAGNAAVSVAAGSANTSAVNNASSTAAVQAAANIASNQPANAGTVGSVSVQQGATLAGNGAAGASMAVQIAAAGAGGAPSISQASTSAQNMANTATDTSKINAINAAASTAAQIVAGQPTGTLDISNIIYGAVNGATAPATSQTVAETIIHSAQNAAAIATIALIAKEKVTTLLPTSNSIATLKGNAKTNIFTPAYNALSSDELKTKSAKAAIVEIAKAAAESAKASIAAEGGSTAKQNQAYSSIMNSIIQAAGSTNDLNALKAAIDSIENAVNSAISNSGVTMDTVTAIKKTIITGTQSGLHAIIVVGSGGTIGGALGTNTPKARAIVNDVFTTDSTIQNKIQAAGSNASTDVQTAVNLAGDNTANGAMAAINAVQSAIQTAFQNAIPTHSGTIVDSSVTAQAAGGAIHSATILASGGDVIPSDGGTASPPSTPPTNSLLNAINSIDVALGGGTSGGTGIAGAVTAAAAAASSIASANVSNAAIDVSNAVTHSGTNTATQNAAATNAILTAAQSAGESAAAFVAANNGTPQQQEAARTAAKAHVINAGTEGGATGAANAINSVAAAIIAGRDAAIAITPPTLTFPTDISTTQNTATTTAAGSAAAAATATGSAAAGGSTSASVAALAAASAASASTGATGGTNTQSGQAAANAAQAASNAGGTASSAVATAAAVAGGGAAGGESGGTQVSTAAGSVGPSTATTTPLIEEDNSVVLSALKPVINKITYDPNFNKTQVISDRRQKFTMGYNQVVSVEMNKDMTSSEITEKKIKFVNNNGADLPRIGTTTVLGKDMSNIIQTNPTYYGDISLVVYVKEGTQTYDYSSGNAELHRQTFPNTEISGNNMDMCFNRFYGENNAYQFPASTNFYDITENSNYKGGQSITNTKQPSVLYTRYRTTSGVIQDISSDFSIDISGEAFWIFSQAELNQSGNKVTDKDASINEIFKNVKLTQPNGAIVNDFSKNIHSIEFVPGTNTDVSKNRVYFKIPPPTNTDDFSFKYNRTNEIYSHPTGISKISFELNPTPFTQSNAIYSKDVPENVYTRDVEIKKSNIYVFPDLSLSETKFYDKTNQEIKKSTYASGVTTDFSYSVGQTIKAKTPLDLGSITNYYIDSNGNEVARHANDISLNLKGFVKIERGTGETIIGPSGEGVHNVATSKKIIHANEDLTWNTDISFESGHMVYTFDLSNNSDISASLSLRSVDVSWGMPAVWSATSGNLAGAQGFVKEKIYSFPSTFDVCGVRLDTNGDISYTTINGVPSHFGIGETTPEHILNSHLKGFGYNIVSQVNTDNCLNLVAFDNDSLFVKKGTPSGTSPVILNATELSSNIVEVKYTYFVDAISTLHNINADANWTKLYSSALHSDFSGADRLTYVMRETHGNKPFRTISNELIVHKFKPTHVNDVYLAVKWKGPDGYMSDYTWAISKISRNQLLATTKERLFPNFSVHDDIRLENKLSSWVNTSPYINILGTQEESDPHMDVSFNITNNIVNKKTFYSSEFGINDDYISGADVSGAALSVTSGTLFKASNIKAGVSVADVSGAISETSTGAAFLRFDDKNQKIQYELKPYITDISDTTKILNDYPDTALFKNTQLTPYTKYVTFHHTSLLKDEKDIGISKMAGFDISYEEPNKFLRFTPLQIGTVVFPHTGNHNVLQTLYRNYQNGVTELGGGVKPLYVIPGNTNHIQDLTHILIEVYGKLPISNNPNIQNKIKTKSINSKNILHIHIAGQDLPAYIDINDNDETTLHGHTGNFKAVILNGATIEAKVHNTVTSAKVNTTEYKVMSQFARNHGMKLTDASFGIDLDISNERHNKEWMTLSIGLNNEKSNMQLLTTTTNNTNFVTYFNKHMKVYVDGTEKTLKTNKDDALSYNALKSIMNTYPWNSDFNVLSYTDSSMSVIFGDTSSNLVALPSQYKQTNDNKGVWYSDTKEIPSLDEEINQQRINKELYGEDGIRKKLGFANIPELRMYKSSTGNDKITDTYEMDTLTHAYIGLYHKNQKRDIIANVNTEVYAETPTTTDMSKVTFSIENGRIKVDLSNVIYGYALKNLMDASYGLINTERWNILADSSKSLHTMPTFKQAITTNTASMLFLASGETMDMTFTSHNTKWTPWRTDFEPYNNMDLSGYRELPNRGVSYEIIESVGGTGTPTVVKYANNKVKLENIVVTPDTSMIYFTMKDDYGNIIKNNARFHERSSFVQNDNSSLNYTDSLAYPLVTYNKFPFVYNPVERIIELSNNKVSSMTNEKRLHMNDNQRLTFKVDKNFASNSHGDWIDLIKMYINGISNSVYTNLVKDIKLSDNSFSFIFDPSGLYMNAVDVSFGIDLRSYKTGGITENISLDTNDFSFMNVNVNGYNPEIHGIEWYDYSTGNYTTTKPTYTILGSDAINYQHRKPINVRVIMKDTTQKATGMMDISNSFVGTNTYPGQSGSSYDLSAQIQQGSVIKTEVNSIKAHNYKALDMSFHVIDISYIDSTIGFKIKSNNGLLDVNKLDYKEYTHGDLTLSQNNLYMIPLKDSHGTLDLVQVYVNTKFSSDNNYIQNITDEMKNSNTYLLSNKNNRITVDISGINNTFKFTTSGGQNMNKYIKKIEYTSSLLANNTWNLIPETQYAIDRKIQYSDKFNRIEFDISKEALTIFNNDATTAPASGFKLRYTLTAPNLGMDNLTDLSFETPVMQIASEGNPRLLTNDVSFLNLESNQYDRTMNTFYYTKTKGSSYDSYVSDVSYGLKVVFDKNNMGSNSFKSGVGSQYFTLSGELRDNNTSVSGEFVLVENPVYTDGSHVIFKFKDVDMEKFGSNGDVKLNIQMHNRTIPTSVTSTDLATIPVVTDLKRFYTVPTSMSSYKLSTSLGGADVSGDVRVLADSGSKYGKTKIVDINYDTNYIEAKLNSVFPNNGLVDISWANVLYSTKMTYPGSSDWKDVSNVKIVGANHDTLQYSICGSVINTNRLWLKYDISMANVKFESGKSNVDISFVEDMSVNMYYNVGVTGQSWAHPDDGNNFY